MQALIILNIKLLLGNCQFANLGLKSTKSSISLRFFCYIFSYFKVSFLLFSFCFLAGAFDLAAFAAAALAALLVG